MSNQKASHWLLKVYKAMRKTYEQKIKDLEAAVGHDVAEAIFNEMMEDNTVYVYPFDRRYLIKLRTELYCQLFVIRNTPFSKNVMRFWINKGLLPNYKGGVLNTSPYIKDYRHISRRRGRRII